jgi:hypothetical protein
MLGVLFTWVIIFALIAYTADKIMRLSVFMTRFSQKQEKEKQEKNREQNIKSAIVKPGCLSNPN